MALLSSFSSLIDILLVPDGLLSQDQQELCERVAHLEKRVREQEDEIVCLKGALADVLRRVGQVESIRSKSCLNKIYC